MPSMPCHVVRTDNGPPYFRVQNSRVLPSTVDFDTAASQPSGHEQTVMLNAWFGILTKCTALQQLKAHPANKPCMHISATTDPPLVALLASHLHHCCSPTLSAHAYMYLMLTLFQPDRTSQPKTNTFFHVGAYIIHGSIFWQLHL